MQVDEDESRPVTLYVERVETNPTFHYMERRRVSVIDLEISRPIADQLIAFLSEREEQDIAGTVRLRFLGTLTHG